MQVETSMAAASASHVGWREADQQLRRLAVVRAGIDAEEARWLRIAADTGVHRQYGYGSLLEYMERVLGYGPHVARERLRVAQAFATLPELDGALASGRISYSAARELTRVAEPWTEGAWLRSAEGLTLREVETAVAGHKPGDLPGDEPDLDLVRHRLRFELPAATMALFREARARLQDERGESLDDAEVLEAMCRAVLGGPREEGRASHQIALTVCEGCGRAWQDGGGQPIEVPQAVVERARCDAQVIGRLDGEQPERASQEVPPAVRRLVLRRDHGRCVVPGCRAGRYLDLHHVRFRSDGGGNDVANLLTLCGGHHDAVHVGRLIIERTAGGLRFTRADGRGYRERTALTGETPFPVGALAAAATTARRAGQPHAEPDPAPIAGNGGVSREAHTVLRRLGFREAEARMAVARAQVNVGQDAALDVLLREALRCTLPGPARPT